MATRSCPICRAPVPVDAGFCPSCGEATPTQISDETVRTGGRFADSDELEYRHRLAKALGDDYEMRDLIGRGGFGAVYAAWDRRLDRDVAVKALRHDLFPTPVVLQRFEREAKAVAKLRHPNILPIYSIGEGEGIAFMIMPLVEGESLRVLIEREGRLPIGEAVRITTETALALEAAHERGFVHRDVKPENIMLDGRDRRVMLMDFGIAKAATADETGLTGTGVIIGSPIYMSPEQARGDGDLDHRADVYALGVVAYELLSGERPYKAKNLHELVYRHVTEDPVPLESVAPDVPRAVATTVMACLAKNRSDRMESARAVTIGLSSRDGSVVAPEVHVPGGKGVGTSLLIGVVIFAFITLGISWLESAANSVQGAGERWEGFAFAIGLLMPFRFLASLLIMTGLVLIAWHVILVYRQHRNIRTALGLSFSRPSRTVVLFSLASATLLTVVTLVWVMPALQVMMASVNAPLPLSARVVIWISQQMQRWWWAVALVAFGGYAWWNQRTRLKSTGVPRGSRSPGP